MDTRKQSIARKFLTFTLKHQLYGVPIESVREINRMSDVTKVPQTPNFVAGVINLRGKVIPVIDLGQKFSLGVTVATKETCIVILETPAGQMGAVVDAVSAVIELTPEQVEPTPQLGGKADMTFILGMGKVEDRVVVLVDIVSALSTEDFKRVMEVPQATSSAAA